MIWILIIGLMIYFAINLALIKALGISYVKDKKQFFQLFFFGLIFASLAVYVIIYFFLAKVLAKSDESQADLDINPEVADDY